MNVTRRGAFIAGAAALAGLLPPSRGLFAAAAQETSPARLLTQAYNASGQQLFKQLASAPGNIVFSPYSIGTAMAMALAGARGETERQMTRCCSSGCRATQIDTANAQVLATLNGYDRSAVPPTCPQGLRFTDRRARGQHRERRLHVPGAARRQQVRRRAYLRAVRAAFGRRCADADKRQRRSSRSNTSRC